MRPFPKKTGSLSVPVFAAPGAPKGFYMRSGCGFWGRERR
jgi:hypothetical protein